MGKHRARSISQGDEKPDYILPSFDFGFKKNPKQILVLLAGFPGEISYSCFTL